MGHPILSILLSTYLCVQLEAEYARGLRRLVARYSPGPSSQDHDTSVETEMVARVLEEVSQYLHISTYTYTSSLSTYSVSRWAILPGSTRWWRTALTPTSARLDIKRQILYIQRFGEYTENYLIDRMAI